MALFGKDIKTKDDLFVHTLKDIYYAEQQITKALPKMIEKASSTRLRSALNNHLRETEGQIDRLERVFEIHGVEPKGIKCDAIIGLIDEAESVMRHAGDDDVRDAAMIAAAQCVEHYEIARYGTLITWAEEMGLDECASILRETLEEEKMADHKLTEVAEGQVNRKAA